jgi:hypothetical protein
MIVLILSLVSALAGSLEDPFPSSGAGPRILLSDTLLDFGTVRQLEEKTMTLSFLNDGNAAFEILDIETDCTCTPVPVSKKVLNPGEAGEIEVTFSADLEPGLRKGRFVIHTNIPEEPDVTVKTRGTIVPEYVFEPPILNFGLCRQEELDQKLYLEITPASAEGLHLKAARCDNDHILVEYDSAIYEDGNPLIVKVELGEDMPPGRFKAQLILETDNPRIAEWKIPVIGVKQGSVNVYPTLLTFGSMKAGETCGRTIGVKSETGCALRIIEVRCPSRAIMTKVKPILKDQEYEIELCLSSSAPAGMIDTEVCILTGVPNQQEHSVRVLGIVLPAKNP